MPNMDIIQTIGRLALAKENTSMSQKLISHVTQGMMGRHHGEFVGKHNQFGEICRAKNSLKMALHNIELVEAAMREELVEVETEAFESMRRQNEQSSEES